MSFAGFCERSLAPALQPGGLVVMDNLDSYKSERVQQIVRSTGAEPVFLPAYSQDLNPIEMVFSKLTQHIRRLRFRTFRNIVAATRNAVGILQAD